MTFTDAERTIVRRLIAQREQVLEGVRDLTAGEELEPCPVIDCPPVEHVGGES